MAGGLVALLDDVAAIAKVAAASIDDVTAAAGRAGAKAAGVVIDDTAVTPRFVAGLSPARELPMIAKIAWGSIKNKLVFLLPAALLLSAFAPWAITPLLMVGGAYLCFEATEKVIEALTGQHHADADADTPKDPAELEKRQVSGAIRTDFILSAEIMAIALSQIEATSIWVEAAALAVVAVAITAGVYGTVAIIVKMDDIGLHLAKKDGKLIQAIGRGLVKAMPKVLSFLSTIGVAAMVWVGGGIIVHGLEAFHLETIPHWVHAADAWARQAVSFAPGLAGWLATAALSAVVGFIVGGVIVAVLHLIPKKKPAH